MSFDLQIWSTQPVDLSAGSPDPNRWRRTGTSWVREGRDWQIVVGASDRVIREDIADEVANLLPGIAFLTELNLSPVSAGANARRIMERLAMRLAKAAHGVIFDPQGGSIITVRGVTRLASLGSSQSASVLALSWWFLSGSLVERSVAGLVSILESNLPEALPKRCGSYEPPQHVYVDTGRDHFISFFQGLGDGLRGLVVWYPHPPITNVALSIPSSVGGSRLGFRCGRLTIEVDEDALAQPGWALGLTRAWQQISLFVQPFYGDVRTLRGFIRRRGRYWSNEGTEHHPVCSWWWAGIPAGPVQAAVLGPPYRAHWLSFCEKAETIDGLSFISTGDWSSNADAFDQTGSPPRNIAQLKGEAGSPDAKREYPKDWPFDPPRNER